MTFSNPPSISQKEYLKKYLSGDDTKKKKKKKISSNSIKRSKIIDDDIDLKNMRPLEDDEVELYQMGEDAPQIAGIVDERPAEVKAQEYYNSKRWKVFGGEDGVSIVDSMDKNEVKPKTEPSPLKELRQSDTSVKHVKSNNKHEKFLKDEDDIRSNKSLTEKCSSKNKRSHSSDSDVSLPRKNDIHFSDRSLKAQKNLRPSYIDSKNSLENTPDRKLYKIKKEASDSDVSPPRKKYSHKVENQSSRREQQNSRHRSDSDTSPPRKNKLKRNTSDSDNSPPRQNKKKDTGISSDSDNSPPRRYKKKSTKNKNVCDYSPSRRDETKRIKLEKDSPNGKYKKENVRYQTDSDNSPPRKDKSINIKRSNYSDNSPSRRDIKKKQKKYSSSDSDNSPPRRKDSRIDRKRSSRSNTPPFKPSLPGKSRPTSDKNVPPRLSRKDLMREKNVKRRFSDSDDSPPRRRKYSNSFSQDRSDSDPPISKKYQHSKNKRSSKKPLYKPNDDSSDGGSKRSKNKMKTTLDGKQAGLQDAKQLKKELTDLKTKEDLMFSKMDASVSGVGAAPIKRDRKTGQIRDMEKEKEIQKEKEAKASVVNEKYYKWGKGLKQVEDAAERAKETMKEMNKPLARYVDDKDLDDFLKAQEREGDPMLDYIKKKQSEATPLAGVKPLYQGSYNPNRFGIRPGHRWDGVVRSNGYEKEWFTHQNARKARDEEAYKWSTSDM